MNPLDFSLWSIISQKMLRQEKEWCDRHSYSEWQESLEEYKVRLRKTALRLSKKDVDKAMAGTKRALRDCVKAEGHHFSSD